MATAKVICSTCKTVIGRTEVSLKDLTITGEIISHSECGCRGDL